MRLIKGSLLYYCKVHKHRCRFWFFWVIKYIVAENPLVCTERVHVLQNGVGVYLPDTVDQICGGESDTMNEVLRKFTQFYAIS